MFVAIFVGIKFVFSVIKVEKFESVQPYYIIKGIKSGSVSFRGTNIITCGECMAGVVADTKTVRVCGKFDDPSQFLEC